MTASGFNAVHVPEAYDGAGADAVATVIVIEEVARVCASSSLIPAVNKLGTMGIILSGSEELKQQVLPSVPVSPDSPDARLESRSTAAPPIEKRRYCLRRCLAGTGAADRKIHIYGARHGALDVGRIHAGHRR